MKGDLWTKITEMPINKACRTDSGQLPEITLLD